MTSPGELYYKYADGIERVQTGYPRRIADDFGSKSDWNDQPGIPNNVDAVWFDMHDAMLYFFKDEWVSDPISLEKFQSFQLSFILSRLSRKHRSDPSAIGL